ncbi:RHS repeat-associated core domain-containing protein [Serratia symbiotica]|uniref:RHS repeat-associated core domain-containing protein n=1 Tax=Serratia symbiotica TaxID=138074 RepID=UPI002091482D|nr:RHS repeat-associated core domain-containing protein [Serratia symbiotica]USS96525.1 RHS repeat-associated core domain-containing protein [Serratia symbiotica]
MQHSIISTVTTTSREEKQFERYQYTAYGETTSYPQSDMHPMSDLANNPLGYHGEHRDPMTGFYYLGEGYRVYSPTLMRFYASDSASPFGQGVLNFYTYCLGDPINLRDPSGYFAMLSLLIGAIVGAVVGATVSAEPKISEPR